MWKDDFMMTFFNVLVQSIKRPYELLQYHSQKWRKVIGYMLFLTLIMSLPAILQSVKLINSFKEDATKIVQKMPDFEIKNNQLTTDKKDSGFVFQTNSVIFTFDPDGKRSVADVSQDGVDRVIPIAFLQDKIVIVSPRVNASADVVDTKTIEIPYHSIPNNDFINREAIKNITSSNFNNMSLIIIFVILNLLVLLLNFALNTLLLTLLANITNRLRFITLRFSQTYRVMVYCASVPILAMSVLQLVFPTIPFGSITLGLTLLVYFNVIHSLMPKNK